MNSNIFTAFFSQVKYSGGTCSDTNIRYFVGFSVVFFFVCAVSIAQLVSYSAARKLYLLILLT